MKELEVKENIVKSMAEPKAPKDLVARTIERGKAIEMGFEAEKELLSSGDKISSSERTLLAAKSIVGRLMQVSKAPNGVTSEKMSMDLASNEAFKKAANKNAKELLESIKNGELVKEINAPKKVKSTTQIDTPQFNLVK